jgi:Ca2+-binding EF-hand superfamily protein/tRNA A-37 threonylcarbamoyl transferase component Bud32
MFQKIKHLFHHKMSDQKIREKLVSLIKEFDFKDVNRVWTALYQETLAATSKAAQTKNEQPIEGDIDIYHLSEDLKAKAIKLFNVADKDGSGTIDEGELFDLLKQLNPSITRPEASIIYHKMDIDRSGSITYDEFLAGLIKFRWDLSKVKIEREFEWEVHFDDLALGKQIGDGVYGTVYIAKWKGSTVAAKVLKLKQNKKKILDEFKNEVAIFAKLRHPNVVLFMGACTEQDDHLTIVTEFMDGGTLKQYQDSHTVDLKQAIKFGKQISFGLSYLHLRGVIHRDLKRENLLIDQKGLIVKLTDFGLSCLIPKDGYVEGQTGTPWLIAPEVWKKQKYNESADIYSFSLTFWEIVCNKEVGDDPKFLPIQNVNQLLEAVVKNGVRPSVPDFVPNDLAILFKNTWDGDPSKRYNMAQIITVLERVSEIL